MPSPAENLEIARRWLAAFNGRDLAQLVGLYATDAEHTSPKLRVREPATGGKVRGHAALNAWWADAFARLPLMRYDAKTLTADGDRVWMEYERIVPGEETLLVAEVLEVRSGKIVASRVFHG